MPRTPAEFVGPLLEEEIRFYDQYGIMPFGEGGMLYSDGYFFAYDQYGIFNLRQDFFTSLVEQENIIYVGKHGDDINDGKTIDEANLTFSGGLADAVALSPSASNPVAVVCLDGGLYDTTAVLTIPSYVHVFAPNAKVRNNTNGNTLWEINPEGTLVINEVEKDVVGGGLCISFLTGGGRATFHANTVRCGNTCNGIQITDVIAPDFVFNSTVRQIFVENGSALVNIGTDAGSQMFLDIGDIIISGTGNGLWNVLQDLTFNGRIGSIEDTGSGIALNIDDGFANINIQEIDCNVACDVEPGAVLCLLANSVSGELINDGTFKFTRSGHGVIGDHLKDGYDEIDADKLGIDFTPNFYSPTISPPEVDNYDHLSAHLAGIDAYFSVVLSSGEGGIDEDEHDELDTLVHNVSEDSYDVITYVGSRITNVTTYEDATLSKKIRDCDIAYQPTSIRIEQVITRQYDAAGAVKETETEDVGYDAFGRLKTIERSKTP